LEKIAVRPRFATYKPKHDNVDNLLSKKIINEDGTPGPEYRLPLNTRYITGNTEFQLSPTNKTRMPRSPLPEWRSDRCLQK